LVQHSLRAAVAVTATLAFGGCSGSDGDNPPPVDGGERIGAPVRLANCRDWNGATLRQRHGTVREIRQVLGGELGGEGGARGRTLDDRKAYDLFDRACSRPYAKGFKLYKLYSRAAAFSQRLPRRP
jgi:hypothetical protein